MLLFLPHKRKKGNETERSHPKRLLLLPQTREPGNPKTREPGNPKTRDSITSQPRRPGEPRQPTLN